MRISFLLCGLGVGIFQSWHSPKACLSTIRGQVSALVVSFKSLLIRTFIHGSPLPQWDLNLVLSVLQKPPLESIQDIPLLSLSESFLPGRYLILHKDKVVLCLSTYFLLKVVLDFHLNENIVLPFLYPLPSHPWKLSERFVCTCPR